MSRQIPEGLAHHIRGMASIWQDDPRSDLDLLDNFAETADHSAFTVLVGRHGASVWAICRSLLADAADAEDAFQATFIALAKKTRESRPEKLAGWLSRVAHDSALDVRKASRRREAAYRRLKEQTRPRSARPDVSPDDGEFRESLQQELDGLPLGLRAPLALYYVEGKSQPEIGRILGMPNQTVSHRIRKGLSVLRRRLADRGVAVSLATLVAVLGGAALANAAPPEELVQATAEAAVEASAAGLAARPTPVPAKPLVAARSMKLLAVGGTVGLALALAILGSRPTDENSEVRGSVLVNQKPLAMAEVVLVPDHGESPKLRAVRTVTDREGRFDLPVAQGRYRVVVVDSMHNSVVPPDYRAILRTPLRVDVGDRAVSFDIPIVPATKQLPWQSPDSDFRVRNQLAFGIPDRMAWLR